MIAAMATELVFQPAWIASSNYFILLRGEEFGRLEFSKGGKAGGMRIRDRDYEIVGSGGRRGQVEVYHKGRVMVLAMLDTEFDEGWRLDCEGERFHWFPESPGSRRYLLKRPHRKRPAAYFVPVRWASRRRVMETGKDVPVTLAIFAAWLALR